MSRPELEVADIFRGHGPAWRQANAGHVSLEQLKVMSAIENCRTAELGGHVARCENEKCGHTQIAYNSCRNRHCPKCQGAAAREWLAASLWTGHAGSPAGPTSFSPWRFSRVCFEGLSWKSLLPLIVPESCSSSASTWR